MLSNTVYQEYKGPDLESQWLQTEPGITGYIGRLVLRIARESGVDPDGETRREKFSAGGTLLENRK